VQKPAHCQQASKLSGHCRCDLLQRDDVRFSCEQKRGLIAQP
jgi:hypothetical protein